MHPRRRLDLFRRGRVEVTGGFLLLMAWLNYSDSQGLLMPAVCAAAAHELGHLAAIGLLGGRVNRLRLSAIGAELQLDGFMGYGSELLCALAGPGVNLALAFTAAQLGQFAFSGLNLAMAVFNLLPLRVLDGGRALSSLFCLLFRAEHGLWISARLEWIGSILLLLCGGIALGMSGNITLLLVAVWLFHHTKGKTWRKRGCQGTRERVKWYMSEFERKRMRHESNVGTHPAQGTKAGPLHRRRI